MSATEEAKKVEAESPTVDPENAENKEDNSSEDDTDNKVVLSDEPKSIIMGIIAQLRKGADLHRVTLPTFVLEPRSMTERITDFLRHPDILIKTMIIGIFPLILLIVKYFLSGWHIMPKGVKKPYNPVLGEIFRCRFKHPDGSEAFYICEQTSHHPPMSSFFYSVPQHGIKINGELKPKAKFLGNSAATIMQGTHSVYLTKFDETYLIPMPNVYARGILIGTMFMEYGDTVTIKCPKNDLSASIEFKTKGFFGGGYNNISGKIYKGKEVLYQLSGKWSSVMYIRKPKDKEKTPFIDIRNEELTPLIVEPNNKQEEFEARRLWEEVTAGLTKKGLDYATEKKTAIEDNQRLLVKKRADEGIEWKPRFFVPSDDGIHTYISPLDK
ncbi:hypothetical protein PIROE2DRAFT_41588 [Piromyces sp. E2]|nr:hypothetical protein PIROE2DRAFT_41588 [Piromyces sp. E2]|eukprot:OUM65507.1 hypothetical protein PIROE2DRAFT_41588 [Piromyces sp. E2]